MLRRRRTGEDEPPKPGSARLVCLRLLGLRDYTAAELRRKLTDRGYAADEISTTLTRLREDGALDDRRAALAHVRTASTIKGRGPLRIRRELEARGVEPATIRQSTEDISDDDVREAIARFLSRKPLPRPIPPDVRRRLFQQLLRRGFPAAAIGAALRMPIPDDSEE